MPMMFPVLLELDHGNKLYLHRIFRPLGYGTCSKTACNDRQYIEPKDMSPSRIKHSTLLLGLFFTFTVVIMKGPNKHLKHQKVFH